MKKVDFKAWDTKRKMFTNFMINDNMFKFMDKVTGVWFRDDEQKRFKLLQNTGLKDKNGKEIYDGDILKIQNSDFYSKKITDKYIGQVCFSRGGFFVLTDGHHTDFCLWGKSTATMEVIGNIYENADLLEVE